MSDLDIINAFLEDKDIMNLVKDYKDEGKKCAIYKVSPAGYQDVHAVKPYDPSGPLPLYIFKD
jgi:hypothetical protein